MRTEPPGSNTVVDVRLDTAAEQERAAFAHEAAMLEQARASARAGRVVDFAKVKAWIDRIGTRHELPVPYSDR